MRSGEKPAVTVRLAHTSQLDRGTLRAVRGLLDEVFGTAMTDHAWDHALGGMHALVWEARQLVAHGSVVQRRLWHRQRSLRAGYVEAVAVRADRRGCGHAARVMDGLEHVVRAAYDMGALGASEMGAGLYRHRGWRPWEGRTWALAPSGLVRTAEVDGNIHVLEVGAVLDVSEDLTCDWREGDVW
jgi:aminoglycoside 2'-N-acetyltransferase I